LASGVISAACDELVDSIPQIVSRIEDVNSVSVICVDLEYCAKPFNKHVDPTAVPHYIVDLDLPPLQRWTEICSNSTFQTTAQYLINTVAGILPDGGADLGGLGKLLNDFYLPSEYAQEIQGCAAVLGVDYGWVTLLNLGYEVSDACTSIVAETTDGQILHARNMDFWEGEGFTNSLKDMAMQVEYQRNGQPLFYATTFAGYVGVLSGMKPNGFSVTINTRFYPQGLGQLFYEVVAAIEERNATLVSYLTRKVFTNDNHFETAIENLSNDELIADVYYTVAGVNSGEGAVISRNRMNATNVWRLDASAGTWFLAQTNYDHWENPPWFDDRVKPAYAAMNAMGQDDLTFDGLWKVLSTKPVFNLQTTYSILAQPSQSYFQSWTRYCPYPCAE
jgi:hypothetical protein